MRYFAWELEFVSNTLTKDVAEIHNLNLLIKLQEPLIKVPGRTRGVSWGASLANLPEERR